MKRRPVVFARAEAHGYSAWCPCCRVLHFLARLPRFPTRLSCPRTSLLSRFRVELAVLETTSDDDVREVGDAAWLLFNGWRASDDFAQFAHPTLGIASSLGRALDAQLALDAMLLARLRRQGRTRAEARLAA